MDKIYLFTQEQGNLLIRLLLAHILADFVLQTTRMAENKRWFNKSMLYHLAIVAACTFLLSFSLKITIIISLSHWLTDALKKQAENKYQGKYLLFAFDQLLHVVVIVWVWAWQYNLFPQWNNFLSFTLFDYKRSLIVLAYAVVIWPLGYVLRFALQDLTPKHENKQELEKLEHGGKLIGQFERIIILTFVLLNQYMAIGFLITGKSIIRFAQKEEKIKSEYVLVGTMMSYATSIIIGVVVNELLKR